MTDSKILTRAESVEAFRKKELENSVAEIYIFIVTRCKDVFRKDTSLFDKFTVTYCQQKIGVVLESALLETGKSPRTARFEVVFGDFEAVFRF